MPSTHTSRAAPRRQARHSALRSGRRRTSQFRPATSGIVAELLVDTDVFIDHLRGASPLRPGRDALSYSTVTRCELFAGDAAQEDAVALLLSPFRELPVDRAVAERAGRLRRD